VSQLVTLSPDDQGQKTRQIPGPGDLLAIASIIRWIWKHAPKSEADIANRPPEVEAKLEQQKVKLQAFATRFGIPIDVMAYSDELLLALQWLEPYFCEVQPVELVDEFIERCPNVAPLLASQPKGVWWIMGFFVPAPNPGDPDYALKEDRRNWIGALLIEIVRYYVEQERVPASVLDEFVGND
jgi:hypothetical protein